MEEPEEWSRVAVVVVDPQNAPLPFHRGIKGTVNQPRRPGLLCRQIQVLRDVVEENQW